jgi:hypothetical protein
MLCLRLGHNRYRAIQKLSAERRGDVIVGFLTGAITNSRPVEFLAVSPDGSLPTFRRIRGGSELLRGFMGAYLPR